jgi:hypothetical protein
VGIGWLASGLVDAAFFVPVLLRAGVRPLGTLLPIWLASLCGYAAGAACLSAWGQTWWSLLASVSSSVAVLALVTLALRPSALRDSTSMIHSAFPRLQRRRGRAV